MAKRIVLLGSTGSIGRQTLAVASALADRIEVIGLAGGNNVELLLKQAEQFRPDYIGSPALDPDHPAIRKLGCDILSLDELAVLPQADLVVVGTVGIAGLAPAIAAVRAGKSVALANKEVLVVAGELVAAEARASGAAIVPIDSEHSAILQCLLGEANTAESSPIARLILTASGGPFRDIDSSKLAQVKPEQALRHPNWAMGPKITVDSATLLNKGLEVIEAHWLFDVPYDQIDVILHRESIVHSMVEFIDGSVKAQLGLPDMRLPIQYALTQPERAPAPWPRLDLLAIGSLSFEPVDVARFPCLRLARQAGQAGGTYPAVLSAADEVAVEAFLAGEIGFQEIPALIERALSGHQNVSHPNMDQVLAADSWTRKHCGALLVTAR